MYLSIAHIIHNIGESLFSYFIYFLLINQEKLWCFYKMWNMVGNNLVWLIIYKTNKYH